MKDKYINFVFIYPLLILILLAIQATQSISFAGVYPDFLLIMMLILAFSRGSFLGVIYAFLIGISLDAMSGTLFGINAFIFTLSASLVVPFQRIVKIANIIVFLVYLSLTTVVKYILYTIFYSLYRGTNLLDPYYILRIPGELLFNIFFGALFYIIIARFDIRDDYEWF